MRTASIIIAEIKAIDADMLELENARKRRTDELISMSGGTPGKQDCGDGYSYTVRENNSYDEKFLKEKLLPGQVKRCSVTKLDKATVKRLYPEVYEASKVRKGYSVTIG